MGCIAFVQLQLPQKREKRGRGGGGGGGIGRLGIQVVGLGTSARG